MFMLNPFQTRMAARFSLFYRPEMSCQVKPFPHPGGFLSIQEKIMDQIQKQALQVTKEFVVKFIEVGRISPSNCHDIFSEIYTEVLKTIVSNTPQISTEDQSEEQDR